MAALVAAPVVHAADETPAGGTTTAQAQASTPPQTSPADPASPASGANDAAGSSDKPAGAGQSDADTAETAPENAAAGPASPGAGEGDAAASAPSAAASAAGDAAGGDDGAADAAAGPASPDAAGSNGAASNDAAPNDAATAQGSEPANDAPTAPVAEQGTSVAQTANAGATAAQDGVGNDTVSVQVDQPGDGSPVSQENQAEGNAGATALAETSGPTTSEQAASAAAQGTQSGVGNTAVNVRVGSAGDNGAVEQANVAAANASTSVTTPANGQGTVAENAAATATQDGTSNTNVSIRVFSPGSDGPVSQSNQAVAQANTSNNPDGATATATQNGVQNTNVSVRVSSDGTSGAVAQQSAASATAPGAGVAIATTDGGLDTSLSVVVDGDQLARPGAGGLQVWEWTWNWDRDESADALPDAQPTSWNWVWSGTGAPNGAQPVQVTTRTAGAGEYTPGSWTWNWDWTREGAPNWAWQWNRSGQLPCGSCVWIWNWTWNWTGQPVQTGSGAVAESSNRAGTPDQANIATANAEATVTANVAQAITQTGDDGEQYAGQLVTVQQVADAEAAATQSDVGTVATANLLTPQVNRARSYSTVTVGADLAQLIEQAVLVDGEGDAAQWSGQEIDVSQQARATAHSGQSGISLRAAGTSLADGQAEATAVAAVDQHVGQEALVDAGTTDQWAGQLTLVEQTGDAISVVEQTGAAAPRFVGGTARARSGSGAVARIHQGVVQGAARDGGLGAQTAMQAVYVGQDGTASASTAQQAGGTSTPATSEARTTNRALVVQEGTQRSTGALSLDIQDLTQQSIVLQIAIAASTSMGGVAGIAVVGNCAIVQQTAGQSIAGGESPLASRDLSAFCAPPATPAAAAGAEPGVTPGAAAAPPVEPVAVGSLPPDELDVELFHGHPRRSAKAHAQRAIPPRSHLVRTEPGVERLLPGSPAMTQVSVPRPTQARFDTRPEGHAGAGDAGAELPLPPAGGPFAWASALAAAAASGGGPAGIAAILAAFMLVPPLLLRAREGSVVRRPIDVLSRVDVPV